MPLIKPLQAASELEGVLRHRPELLEKYRVFYQSFWQDGLVPRRVLELCRRRVAQAPARAAKDSAKMKNRLWLAVNSRSSTLPSRRRWRWRSSYPMACISYLMSRCSKSLRNWDLRVA